MMLKLLSFLFSLVKLKTALITILHSSSDSHTRNVEEFRLGAIMTEEMIRAYTESDKPLS